MLLHVDLSVSVYDRMHELLHAILERVSLACHYSPCQAIQDMTTAARSVLSDSQLAVASTATALVTDARTRQRASEVLGRILRSMLDGSPAERIGIAEGLAGEALFYSTLADSLLHADDQMRLRALAASRLREAARVVATRKSDPGLFTGFTGVAWVAMHVVDANSRSSGDDGLLAVDQALSIALARPAWPYGYDLISGLAGIACYAADRQHLKQARNGLGSVIRFLEQDATTTPNGITWFTRPEQSRSPALRSLFPRGYVDLGIAHGQSGVVGALAYLLRSGCDAPRVRRLLTHASEWLASQISELDRVPEVVGYPETRTSDRLTWCYGRLGLAIALLGAARALGDGALEQLALDLADCAARHTQGDATVADAGLCHGPAGAAFLFGQLYRATGRDALRAASVRWVEQTLAAWETSDTSRTDRSVLTGAAGVGLAVITALHGTTPPWARIFLADVPAIRS